jgi:hypothetical protein
VQENRYPTLAVILFGSRRVGRRNKAKKEGYEQSETVLEFDDAFRDASSSPLGLYDSESA